MNPAIAANQSDWTAFLNPDAETLGPRPAVSPDVGTITQSNTTGNFCLIGNGDVSIAAVPGLVIRAREGLLWIARAGDSVEHIVRGGERFVADRAGRLVVTAIKRSEVELQWPTRQQEHPRAAYVPLAAAA